jgi:F0F1-type ATP synthase assembly protein I
MTEDPRPPQDEGDEEDIEAQMKRIERELEEHFERGQEEVSDGLNPLFTDPPHPGTIPEVLREGPSPAPAKAPSTMSSIAGMGAAWGVAFDFIGTILAGVALGWLFDRWQNTAPWGILVGLALGFVGAFIRIIRATQWAEAKARRTPPLPPAR